MIDGMMRLVAGLPLPQDPNTDGVGSLGMWALAPGPGTERRSRSRRLGELALGFSVLELSGGGKRPRDIATFADGAERREGWTRECSGVTDGGMSRRAGWNVCPGHPWPPTLTLTLPLPLH